MKESFEVNGLCHVHVYHVMHCSRYYYDVYDGHVDRTQYCWVLYIER